MGADGIFKVGGREQADRGRGRLSRQFLRYAMMSGLSLSISMGLPIMLHELLGVAEEAAVALGLLIAFLVNFATLKKFVFGSEGNGSREFVRFAVASGLFRLAEYGLFLFAHIVLALHYVLAIALMLVTSATLKFLVYRSFVFLDDAAAREP